MDLKRDHSVKARRDGAASNKSLFQEYQYFTPGTFFHHSKPFFGNISISFANHVQVFSWD